MAARPRSSAPWRRTARPSSSRTRTWPRPRSSWAAIPRRAGRAPSCRCCIWRRRSMAAGCRSACLDYLAEFLGIPRIRVYEVASFYDMYNTVPVGRTQVRVCTTTPCWLCGSDDVVRACKDTLGVGIGESTAGRAVLPARVRVPGRLRQCAHPLDRRRFLRGHRLCRDQGGARGADARRAAQARAAERAHHLDAAGRQDHAPGRG